MANLIWIGLPYWLKHPKVEPNVIKVVEYFCRQTMPHFIAKIFYMLFFVALLVSSPSHLEIANQFTVGHGTVVVIFFSGDRVVLAADSRLTFSGGRRGHADNQCKVADLGREAIFAASGLSKYSFSPGQKNPAFDAQKTALRAARSLPPEVIDRPKAMAEAWAKQVKTALDTELDRHPQEIISSLHGSSTLLGGGIFAGRSTSRLSVYFAALYCQCGGAHKFSSIQITQIRPSDDGLPAAVVGTQDAMSLFTEMVDATTPRGIDALADITKHTDVPDPGAEATIKTADFILHNTKDPTIGGPINAIELNSSGEVHWVKKEQDCK